MQAVSRVLFLYKNPVGQTAIIARAMRQMGCDVATISFASEQCDEEGNPCDFYFGFDSDSRVLNKLFRMGMFCSVPWGYYDRLHFQGAQSLLPWDLDLPLYRRTGRQVYFTFHGSEVRSPQDPGDESELPRLIATGRQRRTARRISRWSTGIMVTTPDLLEFVPGATYIPVALDLDRFHPTPNSVPDKRAVQVVHAPSRRRLKGTSYVIRAVERLQARGVSVELVLVERRTRLDAIEVYRQADIVVDQLLIGWYGMFAVEAMAMGKPVIAYIRDGLRSYVPDLPVVSATPTTIETVLENLVSDISLRQSLGRAGREFVEQVHEPRKVAARVIDFYASSISSDIIC